MTFNLPKEIEYCINTIEAHGFEAWCVGGAVRDHIMQRDPGDYDVTTNALPENVISMFEKTVPTGLKHGTITVLINGTPIEVTTYRTESGYSDHRRPETIDFVNRVDGDLFRRDFTMNAICYHMSRGIYDPLHGIDDIKSKLIRAVGNAEQRFNEDALRILRAFRFSAQLDFALESSTLSAALKKADTLSIISAERIASEFKRTILSPTPERINPLFLAGGFEHIGINKNAYVSDKIINSPADFPLRFALLCKENNLDSHRISDALKLDNSNKSDVSIFEKMLSMAFNSHADIRRLLSIGGPKLTNTLLEYSAPQMLNNLNEILTRGDAYKVSMLDIRGNDLISIGIEGKNIGKTLETLLNEVIEDPKLNKKEYLLKSAHLSR